MKPGILIPSVYEFVERASGILAEIPESRKVRLNKLVNFIQDRVDTGRTSNLIFICTHNSRRSLMAQILAKTAAVYCGIPGVECFSGGTETTEFNPRAVRALKKAGFKISKTGSVNPVYEVSVSQEIPPIKCFSKTYDDPYNPAENFAAVMTCTDAEERCPVVPGSSARISLPYEDPKLADDTPQESSRYDERVYQIAAEMIYVMTKITPPPVS